MKETTTISAEVCVGRGGQVISYVVTTHSPYIYNLYI